MEYWAPRELTRNIAVHGTAQHTHRVSESIARILSLWLPLLIPPNNSNTPPGVPALRRSGLMRPIRRCRLQCCGAPYRGRPRSHEKLAPTHTLCLTVRIQSAASDLPEKPSLANTLKVQGSIKFAMACLSRSNRSDSRASSCGEGQMYALARTKQPERTSPRGSIYFGMRNGPSSGYLNTGCILLHDGQIGEVLVKGGPERSVIGQ
jgi:hypothetical protein